MTTATTNTVIDHTTDAGYRAWIIDYHNLISAAGLVQTADTGQVNTATVTRPAVNTSNGFATWRLPDSSLYFRFDYGTDFTNFPRILLRVGTGTNGTGTLTGQTSTQQVITADVSTSSSIASTVTNYTSYCCVTNDFFGVHWKAGALGGTAGGAGRALGAWYVMKTVDNTGAATSIGYMVIRNSWHQTGGSGQVLFQSIRLSATSATYALTESGMLPYGLPSSSLNQAGDTIVWPVWGAFPQVLPMLHVVGVRNSEITTLSTFSTAIVGGTSHTYISTGNQGNIYAEPQGSNTNFGLAFLWE